MCGRGRPVLLKMLLLRGGQAGRPVLLSLIAGLALAADPASIAELRRGFERPPDDARMMVRWWWFGPSVTHAQLEREMRLMKEGGIGGFEVQPTYALELDIPPRASRISRS